uniref:Transcription factor TFIIIC triple barrel domain-containing protein n=1 Tax=Oryctolagus cuniculus TaxID=9986 RepID=G1U056_RABIT
MAPWAGTPGRAFSRPCRNGSTGAGELLPDSRWRRRPGGTTDAGARRSAIMAAFGTCLVPCLLPPRWHVCPSFLHQEQLVLVELSGIMDSDFLSKCENKCKILGIDSERPILQVDRYVFAGEYEDTLGTCVIFEENVENGRPFSLSLSLTITLPVKKKKKRYMDPKRVLFAKSKIMEWLQIKDNDFSYRPNMICSFLHENEDEEVAAPAPEKPLELEEQEIQMKDTSNLSYEQEKPQHLEIGNSGPPADTSSEKESSQVSLGTQDVSTNFYCRCHK